VEEPEARVLRFRGLARRVVARFFGAEAVVAEVALLRRSFLDFIGSLLVWRVPGITVCDVQTKGSENIDEMSTSGFKMSRFQVFIGLS
jgi:hypothetical protein